MMNYVVIACRYTDVALCVDASTDSKKGLGGKEQAITQPTILGAWESCPPTSSEMLSLFNICMENNGDIRI